MLQIKVNGEEKWDEREEKFVYTKDYTLNLEHSLVSLSKWESKWRKPFISKNAMTVEETIDYIRCMTLTQNVPLEVYERISDANIEAVADYIESPMTATWFADDKSAKGGRKIVTSEVIYYWMTMLHIPIECQKWHLNRLLTLIRVCNEENKPPSNKKKSKQELAAQFRAANEARKKKFNTKG